MGRMGDISCLPRGVGYLKRIEKDVIISLGKTRFPAYGCRALQFIKAKKIGPIGHSFHERNIASS